MPGHAEILHSFHDKPRGMLQAVQPQRTSKRCAFSEVVNRYSRKGRKAKMPCLTTLLYLRLPNRNSLPFLASESPLLEDEVSSMACSTGFWASSALKKLPAPPRPAYWAPLLDRLTTLHIRC